MKLKSIESFDQLEVGTKVYVGDDTMQVLEKLTQTVLLGWEVDADAWFMLSELQETGYKIEDKQEKWRPWLKEQYYYVDIADGSGTDDTYHHGDSVDEARFKTNNCFQTKAEAEAKLAKIVSILKD